MGAADAAIAVTGAAWSTPLGDSLESVWHRLLGGESGFQTYPAPGRLRNYLAAAVPELSLDLPPTERLVRLTCSTLRQALEAAGRDPADPEVLLITGTSLGSYLEQDPSQKSLSNWADAAARAVGFVNPPLAVSTACSSGSDAILVGAELIRAGVARCCVCGSADVLTWSKRVAHSSLGTLSPTILRAFDERHDGTLLGEGAGFVVLEKEPSRAPLAFLRGTGSANDAAAMTAPDADALGARYALERSLTDAGLEPSAIGLINAHGSGTPLNDATERRAFRDLFAGQGQALVFATKGHLGHSLGATGSLEAIALILALRTGWVPPIFGLEQPDPEFPLPLVRTTATVSEARIGLSLTLGFGGFDTSLIFEVRP
jgi:3-oxoacyl-[acyl-carrier-protein] synthase II